MKMTENKQPGFEDCTKYGLNSDETKRTYNAGSSLLISLLSLPFCHRLTQEGPGQMPAL
jgi:hypothetical protein